GAEVRLALGGTERDAGELTVRDVDAVALHGTPHGAERVVAHLVAEAAGAGVDHDRGLTQVEAERSGGLRVVDLRHLLDLEEVVPRAERAELGAPALQRRLGDGRGLGGGEAAPLLGRLEITRPPEVARHRPARALREELLLLGERQLRDGALRADPGRDRLEERVAETGEMWAEGRRVEPGADETHAAVHVA